MAGRVRNGGAFGRVLGLSTASRGIDVLLFLGGTVVKRKCGTCRFFQDAEIACSGWCTHPDRGELHDLVLVRRAELACRNSWDQDLWEPAVARRRRQPVSEGVTVPGVHPQVTDNPTDRVTSIDIARPTGQPEQDSVHPAVAGGQGSRSVASPETTRHEQTTAQPPQRSGVSSLEPSFQRALRGGAVSPVRRRSEPAGEPRPVVVSGARQRAPEPPEPKVFQSATQVTGRADLANDTRPLPTEALNSVLQRAVPMASDIALARQSEARQARPMRDEPVVHIDAPTVAISATPERFNSSGAVSSENGRMVSPLDETAWVAAIPRCCDTCREFQRDASGQTGYCGNPYAIGRRTMVKSDQLACRSSIGVWWLPSDDTWLDRADVSHHTRPTPFLDAVLAHVGSESR